ncbi:hypothetical protein B7463_g1036, partial [Scytalidium lignicola]
MPERCNYSAPEARPSLTKKSFDSLRSRLQDATGVLQRLFPMSSLEDLVQLNRDALISLLNSSPETSAQSPVVTHNGVQYLNGVSPQSAYTRSGSKSPETFEYDESVDDREGTEAVADDVNSLSLRPDRISSYVGPSSALAGLRVLLSIAPKSNFQNQNTMTRPELSNQNSGTTGGSRAGHVPDRTHDSKLLVDAYFSHIHPKTPILDEQTFRQTLASGLRKDSPWLALLNIVYALGSIALTTSDSFADLPYYNTAKSHLGIESFGSGHVETVQALALMAGWYLHYRNRPNMASAIMGAVFRMANALGLHKELPGDIGGGTDIVAKRHREIRRRIWWCLVVLDAGEATNLGRVSKINLFDSEVNLPSNIDDETGELITGPTVYSNLIADIEFSRQASHIQERLISSPQLSFTESLTLDAHLVYCPQQTEEWNLQVQKALQVFIKLEPWDNTARRQHELISLLYNACIESLKPNFNTAVMIEGLRVQQLPGAGPGPLGSEYLHSEQQQQQQQQNRFWNETTPWDYVFNYQDLYFDFPEMGGAGPNGWDLGLQNFDQS